MVENNTYTHVLTTKYLSNDEINEARIKSSSILSDIKYLKDHSKRTCKNNFLLIPSSLGFEYGDGRLIWRARDILANQHHWIDGHHDNKTNDSMYNYTLHGIILAFSVNLKILQSIFNHKDKDGVNIELIPDFIVWRQRLSTLSSCNAV